MHEIENEQEKNRARAGARERTKHSFIQPLFYSTVDGVAVHGEG
jgi:hypothetical protein